MDAHPGAASPARSCTSVDLVGPHSILGVLSEGEGFLQYLAATHLPSSAIRSKIPTPATTSAE